MRNIKPLSIPLLPGASSSVKSKSKAPTVSLMDVAVAGTMSGHRANRNRAVCGHRANRNGCGSCCHILGAAWLVLRLGCSNRFPNITQLQTDQTG